MKKIYLVTCFILMLILVSCAQVPKDQIIINSTSHELETTETPEDTPKLAFDSSKEYVQIIERKYRRKEGLSTLGYMESYYWHLGQETASSEDRGCIIEGYLVGDSTPLDQSIVTKFVITEINHIGRDVSIKVGDEILVYEPYHYVSYDSIESDKYMAGTVLAEEYYPMERDKIYVIFGTYLPGIVFYDGRPDMLNVEQYPFCITDDAPHKDIRDDCYKSIWYDVKAKYGN